MIIQITVVIFCLFAISRIILRARDRKLSFLGMFLWTTLFASIGVLVLLPQVMVFISDLAGVQRGVDLFIYLSIIALFYLVFKIFITLEKLSQEITACVTHVTMIRYELKEKKK